MEIKADENCEKILKILIIIDRKLRFNELHRILKKYNAKMSKPTLIVHLNHLVKYDLILREEEGKQKVTYTINWNKSKQLKKAKEINQSILNHMKDQEIFKTKSLQWQTAFATATIMIGELFYLKLNILNILEPENKLQNTTSYTMIRQLFNTYLTLLYESCEESKENSLKVLHIIDKNIKRLMEECFVINPEVNQKLKDRTGILQEF